MKWFGERYDAPLYADTEQVPVPVGEFCLYCHEPIEKGDDGFMIPYVGEVIKEVPYHRECQMRSILGSVAHQQRRCTCFGGSGTDHDDGMRPRDGARAALRYFEEHGI